MDQSLRIYFKNEFITNLILLFAGILFICFTIPLLKLSHIVYSGISYSLLAFGVVIIISTFPSILRWPKKKRLFSEGKQNKMIDITKEVRRDIISDLELYEKTSLWFSGLIVLSMIIIFACLLGSRNSLLMGLSIGICITSSLLLCHHLIQGFRKKLILHDINKFIGS